MLNNCSKLLVCLLIFVTSLVTMVGCGGDNGGGIESGQPTNPLPGSIFGSFFIANVYLPGDTWEANVNGYHLTKGKYCPVYDADGRKVGESEPVSFKGSRVFYWDNCDIDKDPFSGACNGAWMGCSENIGTYCEQGTAGSTNYQLTGPQGQTGTVKISWNYQCANPKTKSVECEISQGWDCEASWRRGNNQEGGAPGMIGSFKISYIE